MASAALKLVERRFTLSGDPTAEATIAAQLAEITEAATAALGDRLGALLLVGSYARGEGGVVETARGKGAHNDFDLVALVDDVRGVRGELAHLSHEFSERLGLEVTVWPSLLGVPPPRTLFWLDIAMGGHLLLAGDASLEVIRTLTPRQVPLDEAGRLLANRAVGLALSNFGTAWGRATAARHGHKAALACGDARLLAAARYRPTLAERLAELRQLQPAPSVGAALVEAYADAIRYRGRPDQWRPIDGRDETSWYEDLRVRIRDWHLAYEAWRVGAPATVEGFVASRARLYPRLDDVKPGGAVWASLRAARAGGAALRPWLGHPRERLARVAVALAYGDGAMHQAAARLLGGDDLEPRLRVLAERGG
jgi:hypothetical protein